MISDLTLLISQLQGSLQQLKLCDDTQPVMLDVSLDDTPESLVGMIRDVACFEVAAKVLLFYEKPKYDPEDATEYKLISATSVMGKVHEYLRTGDLGKLMVPLEDGKLELFFKAHQLPAAAAAVAAAAPAGSGFGGSSLHSGQQHHTTTPGSAAAPGGAVSGSSSGAGERMMSSSAGASCVSKSYSRISLIKSKERRKQAGVSSAPDAAPSPVGRGMGKSRVQGYAKYLQQLARANMLRGSNGTYYLSDDQVPANPGFHKVKNMAFAYVKKRVLMKYQVPEELVSEVLNTRLGRVNGQLRRIIGLTQAQVNDLRKRAADARRQQRQQKQGQDDEAGEDENLGSGEGQQQQQQQQDTRLEQQDEEEGEEEGGGEEGGEGEAADAQLGDLCGIELPSKEEEASFRAWLKAEGAQGKLYRLAIKGEHPKEWDQVLDNAMMTVEDQNAALKHSAAQAAAQAATQAPGSGAGGAWACNPAHQVVSSAAAALKQQLDAAAAARRGSSAAAAAAGVGGSSAAAAGFGGSNAAAAGRRKTRGAQGASRGNRGGQVGRQAAMDHDITGDEAEDDSAYTTGTEGDEEDEGDEMEAADALTAMRGAGRAATGGRGQAKAQQQQKKKQKQQQQKAGSKRAREVPSPALPELPGGQRISSRGGRPNPKYQG